MIDTNANTFVPSPAMLEILTILNPDALQYSQIQHTWFLEHVPMDK